MGKWWRGFWRSESRFLLEDPKANMIYVELFPTQTELDGLFVIVQHPTGVTYTNQCGGTSCEQLEAEGFVVPVGRLEHLDNVVHWFRRRFGESCWRDGRIAASPDLANELASVVTEIPCSFEGNPVSLELDKERLAGGCEAWIPVKSAFGNGWLTWINSD